MSGNYAIYNGYIDDVRMKWAKKPTAADIFRAVDGFEFIIVLARVNVGIVRGRARVLTRRIFGG